MFNFEIRSFAPTQIVSAGDIPDFPIVRAGAFVVLRASIANELGLEGVPFTRAQAGAAAFIPDCIVDDADNVEWDGGGYSARPRWSVFLNGQFVGGYFASLAEAVKYVKMALSIVRFGSDQHLATLDAKERDEVVRAVVARNQRDEDNKALLRRGAGEQA